MMVFLLGITVALSIIFVDIPLSHKVKKEKQVAACVIRDGVSPIEKLATETFALPYLRARYDTVIYYNQNIPFKDINTKYEDEQMENALKTALSYKKADIYLLSHGNRYYRYVEFLSNKNHIRYVYNSGCTNAYQHTYWTNEIGAQAYLAHTGKLSLSPFFFIRFIRHWRTPETMNTAITEANQGMKLSLKWINQCYKRNLNLVEQSQGVLYERKETLKKQNLSTTSIYDKAW